MSLSEKVLVDTLEFISNDFYFMDSREGMINIISKSEGIANMNWLIIRILILCSMKDQQLEWVSRPQLVLGKKSFSLEKTVWFELGYLNEIVL